MSQEPNSRPDSPSRSGPPGIRDAAGPEARLKAEDNAGRGQPQPPPGAIAARTQLWYEDTVVVPDEFRDLLVQYSHVPPSEVDEHVLQVRNRAWKVHPYPCLGQFRFLELNLAHRPGDLYPRLLSLLTSSPPSSSSSPPPSATSPAPPGSADPTPLFLDVGACLGQDVRKLIADGAPPHAVAGAELSATFIDLGYELFRDRDRAEAVRMVQADILAPDLLDRGSGGSDSSSSSSSPLAAWRGRLRVVQLGMILHLFGWEEQVAAFVNAIHLLRDERGVLVIGQATGNVDGIETRTLSPGGGGDRTTFKHNVTTFERLVKDVEVRTSTKWVVRAELDEGLSVNDGKRTWDDPRTRRLLFEMERVE